MNNANMIYGGFYQNCPSNDPFMNYNIPNYMNNPNNFYNNPNFNPPINMNNPNNMYNANSQTLNNLIEKVNNLEMRVRLLEKNVNNPNDDNNSVYMI